MYADRRAASQVHALDAHLCLGAALEAERKDATHDRNVADINPLAAVAISVGLLVVGWLVYDALSRWLEGRDRLLALALALPSIYACDAVFPSSLQGCRSVFSRAACRWDCRSGSI